MNNDFIWDIECYPNVFTIAVEHAASPMRWAFEISDWRNDSRAIIEFVQWLASRGARMVGFNSIGFDYPILHTLCRMGHSDALTLYQKAQAIIGAQEDEDRWVHSVKPTDRLVKQVDLYKIYHFDNKAKATGLKVLEFNMRSDNISDLPYPVGTVLTMDQLPLLREYNAHDVSKTKDFMLKSMDMIHFREELETKYPGRDWINFNDTKIGKEYFTMQLEASGVQCFTYGPNGREPRQTRRPSLALNDAILPWIRFENPEFQRVLEWLKGQTITETKGVFTDVIARVGGIDFVFGLGGLHGSVENESFTASDEVVIESIDVASMYPNISIQYGFYPEHLGTKFIDIYRNLYEQRKQYAKGTAENAMLKLALNGTFGDSNNPFSVFYDPLMTMRITLGGQMLLSLLIDNLIKVPTVRVIMCNTDGLEYTVHPSMADHAKAVCEWWEKTTRLQLERARYKQLFILDCNNYIGEFV